MVGENGHAVSGTGFSVNRISEGLYSIAFNHGAKVHALTLTNNNNQYYTSMGVVVRAFNGFQYKTNGTNSESCDAQVAFTALVSYPAGSMSNTLDNRHVIGGWVHVDGSKSLHSSGFSVEKLGSGLRLNHLGKSRNSPLVYILN